MKSFILNQYCKRISQFKQNPDQIQNYVFNYLVSRATETEFGQKYFFSKLLTVADFKKAVPINTYEDLFPYIKKILEGQSNILWPGDIRNIAKSSGTTGISKFIPVSNEALKYCHYQASCYLLTSYLDNINKSTVINFLQGFNFYLAGSRQDEYIYPHKFIADISVILMKNSPWWINWFRTPSLSLAIESNWEEKIVKIAEVIRKQSIVSLSGVPSWILVLIRKVLELSDKKDLSEVWPNLRLFVHGGVNFSPYKQQFQNLISSPLMRYLEAYNASEGFFAWQDNLSKNDMLLSLNNGIYYEFMPLTELDKEDKQTLFLSEVELNKDYALVISTNSGLWRYLLGDVIRFTNLRPYRIILSGRTKGFINLAGEELMEFNVEEAITKASKLTGAIIKNYTVAPLIEEDKVGCHQYLIEFNKEPEDLSIFIENLDKFLQTLNSDYKAKRSSNLNLGLPKVIISKKNLFENWLREKNKLGGQNKIPRLSNNRDFIDQLI